MKVLFYQYRMQVLVNQIQVYITKINEQSYNIHNNKISIPIIVFHSIDGTDQH